MSLNKEAQKIIDKEKQSIGISKILQLNKERDNYMQYLGENQEHIDKIDEQLHDSIHNEDLFLEIAEMEMMNRNGSCCSYSAIREKLISKKKYKLK